VAGVVVTMLVLAAVAASVLALWRKQRQVEARRRAVAAATWATTGEVEGGSSMELSQ